MTAPTPPAGWVPATAPPPPQIPKRFPPRASVAGVIAGLVTLGLALAALESLVGETMLWWAGSTWVGLAAGAAIAVGTTVAVAFRVVSALLFAAVAFLVGGLALAAVGAIGEPTVRLLWLLCAVVGGLDLCYVSRVRFLTLVSGLLLLPLVVEEQSSALPWVLVWLAAALVTLWLLNADSLRALRRPESTTPDTATATLAAGPLVGLLLGALAAGVILAALIGTRSFNFQPLADLAKHLPWQPKLDQQLELDDVAILDFEVDRRGHETRYGLDERGRRFVDSPAGSRLAVVEVDGLDRFLERDGDEVGRFTADGHLVASTPWGADTTYERDDTGWFLPTPAGPYRMDLDDPDGARLLTAPTGEVIGTYGWDRDLSLYGRPGFDALAEATGGTLVLPDPSILLATTGWSAEVTRADGTIHVRDRTLPGSRTYHLGEELEVDVTMPPAGRFRYHFDAEREHLTISWAEGGELGSIRIHRTGNIFDEGPIDPDDPDGHLPTLGTTLRIAAVAVAVLALIGAVWYLRRRRRDDEDEAMRSDRRWAEEELRRLEDLGRRHGVRRRPAASVLAFVDRLDREVDEGEGRLEVAALAVDAGLYGHRPLGVEERARASAVIDRVRDERPSLSRRERRRRRRELDDRDEAERVLTPR